VQIPDPNDPVEKEFRQIEAEDDAAVEEIEKWSDEAGAAGLKGNNEPQMTLNTRIKRRLEPVKKRYEDFLAHHPDYVRARLAFGSFLLQTGEGEGAFAQWEKASQLAPKNPAVWDNLGRYYEDSNVKKAFENYSKAIELDPAQPLYYHNLAACVYIYRSDAAEYWKISEQEALDKSLELYRKAMKLDPANFILATDYAQCFYTMRPPRPEEGLAAWNQCLKIARNEVEREGMYIHIARFQLQLSHFEEAQHALDAITNKMYSVLKDKITQNLNDTVRRVQTNGPTMR
jgi:tetratricopeptide (TPR) repeat protein